jgi:hypothetical protein
VVAQGHILAVAVAVVIEKVLGILLFLEPLTQLL